uniref:Uncharacterized protein n=1 Tax=Arion vulgaris TaxID=1028688 RepID=A0A0B6ZVF2_9EUPU
MLLFLHIVIVLALSTRIIVGQKIVLNDLEFVTPCNEHLRNRTDKYRLTGTYGPNFVSHQDSGWLSFVTVEILKAGSQQFADICSVPVGPEAEYCDPFSTQSCYCDHIDRNDGSAHIVVLVTANTSHSQGIVRAAWQNRNGTYVYSDRNLTVPRIYEVNAASLVLRVNDQEVEETSDTCSSKFIVNEDNTVELCCSKTVSPCYPRISFNETIVAENQNKCAVYTFIPSNESYKVNLLKSYTVCGRADVMQAGSCMMYTSSKKRGVGTGVIIAAVSVTLILLCLLGIGGYFLMKWMKKNHMKPFFVDHEVGAVAKHQPTDGSGDKATPNINGQDYESAQPLVNEKDKSANNENKEDKPKVEFRE